MGGPNERTSMKCSNSDQTKRGALNGRLRLWADQNTAFNEGQQLRDDQQTGKEMGCAVLVGWVVYGWQLWGGVGWSGVWWGLAVVGWGGVVCGVGLAVVGWSGVELSVVGLAVVGWCGVVCEVDVSE